MDEQSEERATVRIEHASKAFTKPTTVSGHDVQNDSKRHQMARSSPVIVTAICLYTLNIRYGTILASRSLHSPRTKVTELNSNSM